MTTEALDFYAYWNGAQVADLWTTLALITGTDDYRSLLLCVALFGLICAAAGAAVRYRGGDLIVWIAAMVFIFSAAFVPRVNIAVRDVRSANVQVVQNIPLGIGWPASVISRASYWLTESFETAFGDVDAARYTRFGVAFPQRVVTTMLSPPTARCRSPTSRNAASFPKFSRTPSSVRSSSTPPTSMHSYPPKTGSIRHVACS